tara:strand:+ start:519 stop:749 length:231 start_codon:yes stop_codon:yes gene_type:complete
MSLLIGARAKFLNNFLENGMIRPLKYPNFISTHIGLKKLWGGTLKYLCIINEKSIDYNRLTSFFLLMPMIFLQSLV